jgi:GTP:adenosylcobinamide-phosphate guanylyltransferase
MGDRVVVIPAHGLGTRLRDVTCGRPKTLVDVGGEPILARLIRAAAAAAPAGQTTRIAVYAQPGDTEIPGFIRQAENVLAGNVSAEVRRRDPRGYLRDLVDISDELGDEFSVVDCDLVAPNSELTGFLSAVAAGWDGEDMVFGVSADPPSSDPRSIRLSPDDGVVCCGYNAASHLPRAAGAYHWRPAAIASARQFTTDSAGGTFHDYVGLLAAEGTHVGVVRFSAALNVNTANDLRLARRYLREWRARGLD